MGGACLPNTQFLKLKGLTGTSLVVYTPNAGGPGLVPGQETRYHVQ